MANNPFNDYERERSQAQQRVQAARVNNQRSTSNRDTIKIPDFVSTRGNVKPPPKPITPPPKPKPNKSRPNGLLGLLDLNNMEMDGDRSVILMLLALLSGKDNESDELLMLALMYIML